MQFIDRVKVKVKAGDGGDGCISFRREKYVPKGGPNGGDGGDGGSIIFVASKDLNTLLPFRYRQEYKAKRGNNGEGSNKKGKNGQDLVLQVPAGTVIINAETGISLCDLVTVGESVCIAKGGLGGRGNARFKSSTNQTPREAEDGTEGEAFSLRLELKLLADVGLVGFPNAGKSTLISALSRAQSKIAAYPFTTLQPVLGVVTDAYGKAFVMADIPGLVLGAHQGVGLGDRFLSHVERTRILLFVLDISHTGLRDPIEDFTVLMQELEAYNPAILDKEKLVVLNKADDADPEKVEKAKAYFTTFPCFLISALGREGLVPLNASLWDFFAD